MTFNVRIKKFLIAACLIVGCFSTTSYATTLFSESNVNLTVPSWGPQYSQDIGSFTGNLVVNFDAAIIGDPGMINVGLRVGDNNYIFHPGYSGGAFRIDGPGGHGNYNMGFTPTMLVPEHMTVTINGSSGSTSIQIFDGNNPSVSYTESFLDTNYMSGVSVLGLSYGGAGTDLFTNIVVSDGQKSAAPVPEPGTVALLGLGMAGLAVYGKRRAKKA
jgi:hypothetical protein